VVGTDYQRRSPQWIFNAHQLADLYRDHGTARTATRLPAPIEAKAGAVPAHNGLRPYDGERVASVWKQSACPSQHQPIRGHKGPSGRFRPPQHNDLLPKHKDFCFQRRSRPKQIDNETKYQPDENQHQAQRRPILYAAPTGFNLRQGQRPVLGGLHHQYARI
jgi:hypothetical protein